jgi:hypothetical protein
VPLVPVVSVGLSLVLGAVVRELFGMFGLGSVVRNFVGGTDCNRSIFISAEVGVQGMNGLRSAVFAWCGAALVLIFDVMRLRSSGEDRRT